MLMHDKTLDDYGHLAKRARLCSINWFGRAMRSKQRANDWRKQPNPSHVLWERLYPRTFGNAKGKKSSRLKRSHKSKQPFFRL